MTNQDWGPITVARMISREKDVRNGDKMVYTDYGLDDDGGLSYGAIENTEHRIMVPEGVSMAKVQYEWCKFLHALYPNKILRWPKDYPSEGALTADEAAEKLANNDCRCDKCDKINHETGRPCDKSIGKNVPQGACGDWFLCYWSARRALERYATGIVENPRG